MATENDPCQSIAGDISLLSEELAALQQEFRGRMRDKAELVRLIRLVQAELIIAEVQLALCRAEFPISPLPPDVQMQINSCLPDALKRSIHDALQEALSGVRSVDTQLVCIEGTERIGLWIDSPSSDESRRIAALPYVRLLREKEGVAVLVTQHFMQRETDSNWTRQAKTVDENGNSTPNGSVHLRDLWFELQPPDTIVTVVTGLYKMPWYLPDFSFRVTVTDHFSIDQDGFVKCTSNVDYSADTAVYDVLGIISAGLFGPGGIIVGLGFVGIGVYAGLQDPPTVSGVGCRFARLLPGRVSIPPFRIGQDPHVNYKDLVAHYTRLEVTAAGIVGAGTYDLIDRKPFGYITTDVSEVIVRPQLPDGSVRRIRPKVFVFNMQPPEFAAWTSDGRVVSTSGSDHSTATIEFDVSGLGPGDRRQYRIGVSVTDADGDVVEVHDEVTVHALGRRR